MSKIKNSFTDEQLDELANSDQYGEYIMEHGDNSEVCICDGDSLIVAMEKGYLFDEFVESL